MTKAIDAIIVPQGAEFQAVSKGLNNVANKPEIIKVPIGTNNINQNLQQWQPERLKKVLMLGLCGSLDRSLNVGEAVVYRSCQKLNSNSVALSSPLLNQIIKQKISIRSVAGLASDRVITSVTEKYSLAAQYQAEAIDMESFGYLKFFSTGTEVSVVRVVSDDLAFDLPNLDSTISSEGNIKPLPMAITMLKRPANSLRFIKNSLNALKSLEKIAREIFTDSY